MTASSNISQKRTFSRSSDWEYSPTDLPNCTSWQWNENHLNLLQIAALKSRDHSPNFLVGVTDKSDESEGRFIKNQRSFAEGNTTRFREIDFDDFYTIKHETSLEILY